jgi:acetyl-CoA carboxylase carboxyltransferase component/acetyl/propionyl-CoA carboxylase alpha subunit|nr:carbamoyl-phosphate synthase large subunit [Aeromicrobium sp.]
MKVLIANRGEIAVRIERAVRGLGWQVQRVHVAEEAGVADTDSILLPQPGVAGYLDVAGIVTAAVDSGAAMVHPGYGFLSESAELARACDQAGLVFVGPAPSALDLFGDKGTAREHAIQQQVPVLEATGGNATLQEVTALLDRHPAGVMIKAVSGGGGRGMRSVKDPDQLAEAYDRCRSEASRAFGNDAVYAERLLPAAKHIEVQVVGDGTGQVVTLGERECSVQRRHQKLIEYAPSPALSADHRSHLLAWASTLVGSLHYRGLATVEFLVNTTPLDDALDAVFIEVNPRLQVEHTVTEEVTAVDLVRAQLLLATGETLAAVGLSRDVPAIPGRFAVQTRINAEEVVDGHVVATTGTVTGLTAPLGVRVDTGLEVGSVVDGTFDSLLAKVITVVDGDLASACRAAAAALDDLAIDGVRTNRTLLKELLIDDVVTSGRATTSWLDEVLAERVDAARPERPTGDVRATMSGTVMHVAVKPGDPVGPRTSLVTLESMKMEHPVTAGVAGTVRSVAVEVGGQVAAGDIVVVVEPDDSVEHAHPEESSIDLDAIRPDLAELHARVAATRDAARHEAVAKRHARGHLTTREWVDQLVDPGTFVEYGSLPVAAQRTRRSLDDLIANTPADGLVTGLGTINGSADDLTTRQAAVVAYDYSVLAGTQGYFNHKKTDRLLQLAHQRRLPVVLFAEGGGGRPGDTDTAHLMAAGLTVSTFAAMGSLSGVVPTIGILTGRCFAGNAALLGCCDVIIATRDSNLGMAGPAMIEGGGLGRFTPEQIGPMSVQSPNGVVDVVVDDDAQAIEVAQRYLSYFQGPSTVWTAADQRRLRHVIGENRKEVYDIDEVIELIADEDSVLKLRADFGVGAVTALVRIEGRPYGLVANDPRHLGGAIDADAADKMARFLQLCDAHDLPVVSLCDTPGFMVGPDSEQTATVRHFSRLFVIAAHLHVPMTTIVLRKGYGLGAQAMAAGSFAQTTATVAWPTGEIGGMGLEGAVRLGYAKELDGIDDPALRDARYDELVAQHYEAGKAINGAMKLELDEVIDPIDTRRWIVATLSGWRPDPARPRRYVDTW